MAKYKDRDLAISLRKQGMSYSQIKEHLNVSKSSLSLWLKKYPLSQERIKELRDHSEKRIENFRNTMRLKKDARLNLAYESAKKDIGRINKRELFIAGLMLYWAEGTKWDLAFTNTNVAMLKVFIKWLYLMKVDAKKIKVQLQLYKDMDIVEKENYWSRELKIPISQFRKVYIKKTYSNRINYKGAFGNGTCTVLYHDQKLVNYIAMALKYEYFPIPKLHPNHIISFY